MTLVASDMRRSGEPLAAASRPSHFPFGVPGTLLGRRLRFGRWLLGSPLYSLTVGYGTPRSFFAVAPDPWPGDSAKGRRLMAGGYAAHGIVGPVTVDTGNPPWNRPGVPALWLDALNGFTWLRDL